tara:strand:- start:37598 stop:37969 length:372 start_codon:yes stop_codon:yes gene_type:complete
MLTTVEPFSSWRVLSLQDMNFPPIVLARCPAVTPPTARQIDIARWIPSTQRAIFRWAFNIPAIFRQYSGNWALSRALMHDPPANIALHNTTPCAYIGFRDQERSEQDRKKTKDEKNGIYEAVI